MERQNASSNALILTILYVFQGVFLTGFCSYAKDHERSDSPRTFNNADFLIDFIFGFSAHSLTVKHTLKLLRQKRFFALKK